MNRTHERTSAHDGPTVSFKLAAVVLPLLAASQLGCIRRYDLQLYSGTKLPPDNAQMEAAFTFPFHQRKGTESITVVLEQWPKVEATCTIVRGGMVTEADGINMKNKAIGASFAALTAGLATASGLYGTLADKPDPKVAAVLAFGATGTSVPTFFFFGSDDREKVVRDRIKSIDDRRAHVEEVWANFNKADRATASAVKARDDAKKIRDDLEKHTKCATPADDDERKKCEDTEKVLVAALKANEEAQSTWHEAAYAFSDAVIKLQNVCR